MEAQIEEGPRRDGAFSAAKQVEIERSRKRDSLEMSRRSVAHDLETARTETHRSALRNALAYIDGELGKLDR